MHINAVKRKAEENDAKVNRRTSDWKCQKLYISWKRQASLHGIMTVQKTYKDYSRNSSVQRVTIYNMERQWNNDW